MGYRLWTIDTPQGQKRLWDQGVEPSGVGAEWGLLMEPHDREPDAGWQLFLDLLNLEREVPVTDSVDSSTAFWTLRSALNRNVPGVTWDDWVGFLQQYDASYLRVEDQGHPLLWIRGADGTFLGVLLNFGLIPGQSYWWVPGLEHVQIDPNSGQASLIMGQTHEEAAASRTLREFMATLPPAWVGDFLSQQGSVREILERELRRHALTESDRCQFVVYHPQQVVHGYSSDDPPYALETAEVERKLLVDIAWTVLSPHLERWAMAWRSDWGRELNADPNLDDPVTVKAMRALSTAERFRRICAEAGRSPLQYWLNRLTSPQQVSVIPRRIHYLAAKTSDRFWLNSEDPVIRQGRLDQTRNARKQLARHAMKATVLYTTDILSVTAWLLQDLIDTDQTLRACPHPQCGLAFLTTDYHQQYCPQHRDDKARSARQRWKKHFAAEWDRPTK